MLGRRVVICLLMLGSTALYFYSPKAWSQDSGKSETKFYESLRGKWLLQSREVAGKRLDFPDGCFKLLTDDRMLQRYSPLESSEGPGPTLVGNTHYRIDVTSDPPAIDAWGKTDMTDVDEGIFRLEKGTLTLCWAAKGM